MIRWRGWLIVALGLAIDWSLTTLFLWRVREAAIANPLGPWLYILGSLATFCGGMVVGYLVFLAPLRFGFGMVSLDLFATALAGIVAPQPLSLMLISRIVVAFMSAGFGALVGKSMFVGLVRDRSTLGRCIGMTLLQILVAGLGGVVTVILLRYGRA